MSATSACSVLAPPPVLRSRHVARRTRLAVTRRPRSSSARRHSRRSGSCTGSTRCSRRTRPDAAARSRCCSRGSPAADPGPRSTASTIGSPGRTHRQGGGGAGTSHTSIRLVMRVLGGSTSSPFVAILTLVPRLSSQSVPARLLPLLPPHLPACSRCSPQAPAPQYSRIHGFHHNPTRMLHPVWYPSTPCLPTYLHAADAGF